MWEIPDMFLLHFWYIFDGFLRYLNVRDSRYVSASFLIYFWWISEICLLFFLMDFWWVFWYISCRFPRYLWFISDWFLIYVWLMSDGFPRYFRWIWDISGVFLMGFWNMSDVFVLYVWDISDGLQMGFWNMSDSFWNISEIFPICFWSISDGFLKYFEMCPISVWLISYICLVDVWNSSYVFLMGFWDICEIFVIDFWNISEIFLMHVWWISEICLMDFWAISVLFLMDFWDISDGFLKYFGDSSEIYLIDFWHISDWYLQSLLILCANMDSYLEIINMNCINFIQHIQRLWIQRDTKWEYLLKQIVCWGPWRHSSAWTARWNPSSWTSRWLPQPQLRRTWKNVDNSKWYSCGFAMRTARTGNRTERKEAGLLGPTKSWRGQTWPSLACQQLEPNWGPTWRNLCTFGRKLGLARTTWSCVGASGVAQSGQQGFARTKPQKVGNSSKHARFQHVALRVR
jgi:hypothetical protein